MKLRLIIILFALVCLPQTFQAKPLDPPSASGANPQAIIGIWQLKEAYLNTTRFSDSLIANVYYVMDPVQNTAYVIKGDQAVKYNLTYNITGLNVKLLNPTTGAELFNYNIANLTETILILTSQTVDPTNANIKHDQEFRFVRVNDFVVPTTTQQ